MQTKTLTQRLVLGTNHQKSIPSNVWLVYQCLDFLTGDPLVWKENQQEQWAFGKEKAKANYSFYQHKACRSSCLKKRRLNSSNPQTSLTDSVTDVKP